MLISAKKSVDFAIYMFRNSAYQKNSLKECVFFNSALKTYQKITWE